MLKSIFIDGKLPYLAQIKTVLYVLAWLAPFSIFFLYTSYNDFAEIGWNCLVAVLAIRPISDIFPNIGLFRILRSLRREFGVFSGMMIVAHFVGFLLNDKVALSEIFTNPVYRRTDFYYL